MSVLDDCTMKGSNPGRAAITVWRVAARTIEYTFVRYFPLAEPNSTACVSGMP